MSRFITLAAWVFGASLFVTSIASASDSQSTTAIMLTLPTAGAAGIEAATRSEQNKAYGLTADEHIGYGYSTRYGKIAAIHAQMGALEKTFFGPSGYFQYGVGVAAQGGFFGEHEMGLGVLMKFGNDWKTSSGLVIGAEWLGASIVLAKSESTILARLPSLRIGWAF